MRADSCLWLYVFSVILFNTLDLRAHLASEEFGLLEYLDNGIKGLSVYEDILCEDRIAITSSIIL